MKKLLFLTSILFLISGCGSAQIAGVGYRCVYCATLPTPTSSLASGTYSGTQSVTLGVPVVAGTICYTTDETLPAGVGGTCTHGTTYSTAISVSTTTTLKAIMTSFSCPAPYNRTFDAGCGEANSPVSVWNYVIGSIGFVDNFPYSDGNLNSVSGGNWTNDSTASTQLYVSSNIVAGSTSNNCSGGATEPCFVRWTGSGGPAPANQSTQVTFTGISSAQLGPAVRVDTGGAKTGYALTCNYDVSFSAITCQLFKVVAGTGTLLENPGITVSSTATVKLTASGTSPTVLTAYVNGTTYTTYTDSSSPITSGTWGLANYLTNGDTHIDQAVGTTP